ncbi:hypothetical protein [Tenacibaculum xiamenense]|uniref:hypothetical protein n=1 Tax=Tenacibaculum xiamenense TaxID=1261553 RepID=UPI0038B4E2A3
MKDLKNFKVEELNAEELTFVNGGESGWYYLAREAKRLYNVNKGMVLVAFHYIDSL